VLACMSQKGYVVAVSKVRRHTEKCAGIWRRLLMIPNKAGMPLYTKSASHHCPSGRRSAGIRWVHGRQYGILLAHAAWGGGLVAARSET